MRPGSIALRLFVFLLCTTVAVAASADVIDPFTAPQGPLTVGPGEEPTPEEAIVFSSSILGGFRLATPAVDELSQAGSTATMEIAGGELDCLVDFPSLGNADNIGGCATAYDRSDGPVFDLKGSSRFLIQVRSVQGEMYMAVLLIDSNEEASLGFSETVAPGQVEIAFDDLQPLDSIEGVDLSLVNSIVFVLANQEGREGRVILTGISTDGAITAGPVVPVDDEIVAEEIPGTYFNPSRDGEGCQLTLERDQVTFILTCYFYKEGEQFWMIGVGQLVNGQILFGEMTVTSGAHYGDGFDPADVVRSNWGSATMSWGDCNNAALELNPIMPGFENVTLDLTRIVPTTCGSGAIQDSSLPWMGAYYDPARDGEGFHLGIEVGGVFVMTWYTYLDGRQVWMIGTGVRDGQQVVFSDVVITSGAGFGSSFDPDDVIKEPFGQITVDFSDCNNFTATVNSERPEFHDLVLDVTKIVAGTCP
jgi:hypothetical protein